MAELLGDRLIVRRVGTGLVATAGVLLATPGPRVLAAAALCVWPLGALEWLSVRRQTRQCDPLDRLAAA